MSEYNFKGIKVLWVCELIAKIFIFHPPIVLCHSQSQESCN